MATRNINGASLAWSALDAKPCTLFNQLPFAYGWIGDCGLIVKQYCDYEGIDIEIGLYFCFF